MALKLHILASYLVQQIYKLLLKVFKVQNSCGVRGIFILMTYAAIGKFPVFINTQTEKKHDD